jgi:hypothetical protein
MDSGFAPSGAPRNEAVVVASFAAQNLGVSENDIGSSMITIKRKKPALSAGFSILATFAVL